jgi:hypothetical protein
MPTSARASGGLAGLAAFGGGLVWPPSAAGLVWPPSAAALVWPPSAAALATGSPVTRFLRRSRENGWVGAERFL